MPTGVYLYVMGPAWGGFNPLMASSTPCVMDAEELGFNTRIRVVCRTKWVVIVPSVTMEIHISRLLK